MPVGNTPDATTPSGASDGGRHGTRHLDPSALKAYAHPLRLAIIHTLNDRGPATATTLARHLGESTGQTSYHLRQLARHGLVREDTSRGTGRERWWEAVSMQVDASTLQHDSTTAPAARLLLSEMVRHRTETLEAWVSSPEPDPAWVERAVHSEMTLQLLPEELAGLNDAVAAAAEPYIDLSRSRRGSDRTVGTRVRVYYDAFPLVDPSTGDGDGTGERPADGQGEGFADGTGQAPGR